MKKISFLSGLITLVCSITAQVPSGYYNGTENLSGQSLKSALHNIIDNHNSVSYTSLWTHMQNTDKKSNNYVWDMYSDVPGGTPAYNFTFVSDQCGNYSQEGDCYNREHSWPQSWFNSASPMKTDLFHVFPTDGYVNGQRGSYPFGEVGTATWTSTNGSKKGTCTYPGYSGIVFEPIDSYKGDFARAYFYMSTRYYNEDGTWQNNDMVNGAEILPWAKNLLIEWHINDPVSTKEINRNNEVYSIQGNRNPFIDHPEFTVLIFSDDYPLPAISSSPIISAEEGTLYEYVIVAADSYNNQLYFDTINIPSWLNLTDNGNNTATLWGTPGSFDLGINEVSISVSNGYSLPVEHQFDIDVSAITYVQLLDDNMKLQIFPNPAVSLLNIHCPACEVGSVVQIFNQIGKSMYIKELRDSLSIISLKIDHLPSGVYFICIQKNNGILRSSFLVE